MDPDAALTEIRQLTEEHSTYGELSDGNTSRLVELIESLDNWVSSQGFLPDPWSAKRG
jgi:hypothetical protein